MTDSGFLWIMAVGGWVFALVAFIGFLIMEHYCGEALKLASDILEAWKAEGADHV